MGRTHSDRPPDILPHVAAPARAFRRSDGPGPPRRNRLHLSRRPRHKGAAAFGWRAAEAGGLRPAHVLQHRGLSTGGLFAPVHPAGPPDHVALYLAVDDARARTAAAVAAGDTGARRAVRRCQRRGGWRPWSIRSARSRRRGNRTGSRAGGHQDDLGGQPSGPRPPRARPRGVPRVLPAIRPSHRRGAVRARWRAASCCPRASRAGWCSSRTSPEPRHLAHGEEARSGHQLVASAAPTGTRRRSPARCSTRSTTSARTASGAGTPCGLRQATNPSGRTRTAPSGPMP